jgi:hypothetical protein
LIGLDTTTELKCSKNEFLYKSASLLRGQGNLNIPVSAVTAIYTGFSKNIKYLVIAILAACFAIWSMLLISVDAKILILTLFCIGIAVAFVIAYRRSKTMTLVISNGSSLGIFGLGLIYIAVKKCGEIDFDTFEAAAALLNKTVYEHTANKK